MTCFFLCLLSAVEYVEAASIGTEVYGTTAGLGFWK
jgi:hypothetical protein